MRALELGRAEKALVRRKTGLDPASPEVRLARLKEWYYKFPPGCLVVIEKRARWFYILHGNAMFHGPIGNGIYAAIKGD